VISKDSDNYLRLETTSATGAFCPALA